MNTQLPTLRPSELRVVEELVKDPRKDLAIAYDLGISKETVRDHMKSVFRKWNAKNRAEVVAKALRAGLFLTFALTTFGQSRITPSGPVVAAGSPAVINLNFAGGGLAVAGVQVIYTVPTGTTITPGPIVTGNLAMFSAVNNGAAIIGVYSADDKQTIPDGVLAILTFPSPGAFTFTPSSYVSVNLLGQVGSLTVATLAWANPCDVNGDGIVDDKDVTTAIVQIQGVPLGGVACTTADVSKDGVCSIQDLIVIERAKVGGACKVGP